MTGHPTSGQPADREPTPTHPTPASLNSASLNSAGTGAAHTDPASPRAAGAGTAGVGAAGGSDSELDVDRDLAASADRLLEVLQSTLDVNAGLAAIRATHRTATGPPITNRPDSGLQTGAVNEPDNAGHPGGTGRLDQPENAGEVGAVCSVLTGYLTALTPAGEERTGTAMALGGSVLTLGAVYRMVRELRNGLLHRTLDRPGADRLLRLIDHNTTEAGHLLREEAHRASRRVRPQIEGWARINAEVRDGMAELRPRIARLYDDTDQTAQPAEPLPV